MIFITLGSQKFQFNRLLRAVDELIEKVLLMILCLLKLVIVIMSRSIFNISSSLIEKSLLHRKICVTF